MYSNHEEFRVGHEQAGAEPEAEVMLSFDELIPPETDTYYHLEKFSKERSYTEEKRNTRWHHNRN